MKPDIIAPGNKVISLYAADSTLYRWNSVSDAGLPMSAYNKSPCNGISNMYFVLSGTSMAAPVVSGAAALLLEKYPNLSPDTIKARLMSSADKWTDPSGAADACTYGAGYLNIPKALASTVTPTRSALSPQLSIAGGIVTLDPSKIGGATLWGSKAISGVSAIYGTKAISGSKAISGVSTIAASKALSGSSVWADKALSGSSCTAVDLSSVALSGE